MSWWTILSVLNFYSNTCRTGHCLMMFISFSIQRMVIDERPYYSSPKNGNPPIKTKTMLVLCSFMQSWINCRPIINIENIDMCAHIFDEANNLYYIPPTKRSASFNDIWNNSEFIWLELSCSVFNSINVVMFRGSQWESLKRVVLFIAYLWVVVL